MQSTKPPGQLARIGECGNPLAEYAYRGSYVQRLLLVMGILAIVTIVASPLGLIALAMALLRNPRVLVYADGLLLLRGKKRDECRWKDVEAFRQHHVMNQISRITSYTYYVRRRDGKEFKFDATYRNVKELGETIRTRTFGRLLAAAQATLARGEKVTFGSIWSTQEQLGQDSLETHKRWRELKHFDIRLSEGFLIIDKGRRKTWAGEVVDELVIQESIQRIPNPSVLLALLQERLALPQPIRQLFPELS